MEFEKLLGTLARSSAQAVSTLDNASDNSDEFKQYLYIDTAIERDFKAALDSNPEPLSIIFLCGSSGDGKSEILKRHYKRYSDKFKFYLDATHSFKPDQNAIQALDQVFDQHREAKKPLVIGVNVGMLFNYASSGAERHVEIRNSIASFTQANPPKNRHVFLNFEDYPKFSLQDGSTGSAFIKDLLERITTPSDKNPLYQLYKAECDTSTSQNCDNYRLLQEKATQECIITLLLHARLRFDQFLSARTLLDFVHHLICGPGLIFDNLFVRGQSDLTDTLSHFDPCSIRSQRIDQFLVQQSLEVENSEFQAFKSTVLTAFGFENLNAAGWLRAFYVLQNRSLGNNYHKQFKEDYQRSLYEQYIEVWQHHAKFSGDNEERQQLRRFYQEQLVSALLRFGNRLLPSLTKRKHVYLCERNGVVISAQADIRPDFKRVKSSQSKNIHHFQVCLKVEGIPLKPFPVNVSFLELVIKINDGYRPNRHDKNTIVILEEMVEEIAKIARHVKTIHFSSATTQVSLTNEIDDDEFVVGGAE